jgi:ADP-ribose pyrophosphatase YjhB (NUDIX family)
LLCHRRVELRWYPGVWDVAGAHLRHGEPPAACAVRAARDELGITIFGPEQLLEHTEDDFRLTLFLVTSWEGEIRNASTAQHDQVRLLTREQATSLKLADKRYLSLFDHIAA